MRRPLKHYVSVQDFGGLAVAKLVAVGCFLGIRLFTGHDPLQVLTHPAMVDPILSAMAWSPIVISILMVLTIGLAINNRRELYALADAGK